jgi:asparagine synthase (glutamine-hydrolysing)
MCGIAGLIASGSEPPEQNPLEAMAAAMLHRGPDEGAVRTFGRAAFAFRRLSIIDVTGGAQPIANEDATCHIICNGEIYNYKPLRDELLGLGHRFRTASDVETILHGYEEWGDRVVERLRGMFALALWDEKRQRLLLARDRLGKKPLVYCEWPGGLAFASELQGLLAHPRVPRRIALDAVHQYLTYQYVPAPLTAFQGVLKLPPAHRLVWERERIRVERYWLPSSQPPLAIGEGEAAVELRRLLGEAVRSRLMSEVPLGAFLSGGIDSSSVVALMAEHGRVKTFSIGFEEQAFSELPYARLVAQRYDTEHHEFIVRPDAAEILPKLVRHYGEPYADSSALPTYYLARMTRQHVTVALNGDGGDELFAGYDRYQALSVYSAAARLRRVRRTAQRLVRALGRRVPVRLGRLVRAAADRPEESYARTMSCFVPEEKLALYSPELRSQLERNNAFGPLDELYGLADAPDLLGRTLFVDTLSYLPGDLLAKVDIATMACGLEGRSPFLDQEVVEFAARLPSALKLRGCKGKRVLRRAVRDLLPDAILSRSKKGFGVPIGRWFRGSLHDFAHELLFSQTATERPYFSRAEVRRIWEEHQHGHERGHQIWALVCFELWHRQFLDGSHGA